MSTNPCLPLQITGSAERCNVRCEPRPITACMSGDACCPQGCDAASDAECPPPADPALGCFEWQNVSNIETQTTAPRGAVLAGVETIVGDTTSFSRYVCRGDGGDGAGVKVGKATFGFGCYLPGETRPATVINNVQVLVRTAQTECLGWDPPNGSKVPVSAVMQNGAFICRANHEGVANDFNNRISMGTHVGQVVTQASSPACAFEFYGDRVVATTGFEILVRLSN